MALELPTYKMPALRTALLTTFDRGLVFVKSAGTNIIAILIVLWWLGAYPSVPKPPEAIKLQEQARLVQPSDEATAAAKGEEADRLHERADQAAALNAEADRITARHAKSESFLGHIGRAIEPVFRPFGYDRQLSVGILASFAAREVFVSTMAVVVSGEDYNEENKVHVMDEIAAAKRDDGTPIFTAATSWSLLIYYVLAMQCLPTLVVTAREAGGVKWALLQLAWMSGWAYAAAFIVFHALKARGCRMSPVLRRLA